MKINPKNVEINSIKYKDHFKTPEEGNAGKDVFIPSSKEEKEWTFLVYLDATDEHDKLALYKLRELEKAGSSDKVNIVAEVTRDKHLLDKIAGDREGTRRYYVTKNEHNRMSHALHLYLPRHTHTIKSPVLEELPTQNQGDPETLKNFIEWGIKNYPAKNYGVIISSTGAGVEGVMGQAEDRLTLPEFKEVMGHVKNSTGKNIDLMVLDESNSATLEVATEISGTADYLVASEAELHGIKFPLGKTMATITKGIDEKGKISPEEAGKAFLYEAGRRKYSKISSPAVSLLDLNKIPEVEKALKDFTALIKNNPDRELFRNLIKRSQQFYTTYGKKDMLDLKDFAFNVAKEFENKDPLIVKTSQKLDKAIEAAVVTNHYEGEEVDFACGLAVYAPEKKDMRTDRILNKVYPELTLNKETGWNDFIQAVSKDRVFYKFLASLGIREEHFKVLDKFFKLAYQSLNIGIAVGGIGMGLSVLKQVVNGGQLGGALGTTVAYVLGGTQIAYGAKNAYRHMTDEEVKEKKHLADPLFCTMEGVAITSTLALPSKVLGSAGQNIAQTIGAAGGAYHAFKGAYNVFSAIKDNELVNKKEKIIDCAMDGAQGLAVMAVTMGMLFGAGAGVTTPAAIAAAAIPAVRVIYNLLTNVKDLKEEEMDPKSFQEKLESIPVLSSVKPKHYVSPTIQGILEGIGQVDV